MINVIQTIRIQHGIRKTPEISAIFKYMNNLLEERTATKNSIYNTNKKDIINVRNVQNLYE